MAIHQDFEELLLCLNAAKVRYLIIGAHAVAFYTEPRYTKDMDIWVDPSPDNAKKVFKALAEFGAPMKKVAVEDFSNPQMVYQIGVEPVRIDILMGIGFDFSLAWKNRKKSKFGKASVNIIGFKDLLKSKKIAGRPKDKIDAEKLMNAKK